MDKIQTWPNGCQAAVSLTYDDGLPNHYQLVAPSLEAAGLRGTFYTPLKSDLMQNPLAWRAMARRGHELGNHAVFHPCWSPRGELNDWLEEDFNTLYYDAAQWIAEMAAANSVLKLIDGSESRTFGNPCFDNFLGTFDAPCCLEPLIETLFLAARGEETRKPVDMTSPNWNNLGSVWADRRSFEDFLPEIEEALDTGGWLIYTFHGVGAGAHHLFIDQGEHEKLLAFLKDWANRIWAAPVIEVARHFRG